MSLSTLYLCYFGIREPLVQTQVLPYLRQLAVAGIKVNLLTFEPRLQQLWSEQELTREREKLASENINWHYLPYHKRPSLPATLYDITAGARFAARMIRREGVNVLHARGHVPMAMALSAQRLTRSKLVFDIRGLMAEEYVDGEVWTPNSPQFRAIKMIEHAGLRRADQVVVLTRRMRDWLVEHELKKAEDIEVIPCCVDFDRFKAGLTNVGQTNSEEPLPGRATDRFEIVYAGSLTGLYLVEEMGRFFMAVKARRPDAFLRILSGSEPEASATAFKRIGLGIDDFWIGSVTPAEVPKYLSQAQLGVSFRKPTFAQIAASPTKIPEYLAAGVPVVGNAGIGDMDELIEQERVGVILRAFDEQAFERAAEQALTLLEDEDVQARSVRVAHQYFDLKSIGGRGYINVYERLK
ncbi:MAG TPA: glycosyltransferase [Pyrinomonadaceae bacterium]|nr:glycosyltransferase [Pyrinomonadaceae bacterium]